MSLLPRHFVHIEQHNGPSIKFRQFNTLADSLAISGFEIEKTNKKVLDWEYRYPLIIAEIGSESPDFVTLDELDASKLLDVQKGLTDYSAIYYKKTKDDNKDGCAILYRNHSYTFFNLQ